MPIQCLRSLLVPSLLTACAPTSFISALGQSPQVYTVPARITTAISESSLVPLPGNVPALVHGSFDNGPAPISMPATRMLLVLSRSTQQEADLQTFLQSAQNRNSPSYHKFLSPDEFGKRFGIGDADLQTVEAWLIGRGFVVNQVHAGRTAIEFSGTVGQVQDAFHTSVHGYTINGQNFWASAVDLQIPSALASVVAGIASLNSIKPKAHYIRGPSGRYDAQSHTFTPTYTLGDATNGYYILLGPADAATIYDTPTTLNPNRSGTTYDGTGVNIGIAGDSNIDLAQNANYRATFGLPAKATTVVVDGADPGENGDAIEAYLDTQVAGGVAPNANIILYTASDTTYQSGLILAITRAIDDNMVDILNVSFGNCEAILGTAGNQLMNNLWEQAAAQGISVTVSTGDSGSAGCDDPNTETIAVNGLGVNGMASTPYNIAVGGTDYDALYSSFPSSFTTYVDVTNSLPNHRSALRYIPEEPWNDSTFPNTSILQNVPISVASHYASPDNIVGAGGGISTVYPAPGWQTGFGSRTGRSLPDVSFLAGNGLYGAGWGICTDFDRDASGNPIADCAAGSTGNSFNLTGIGGTSAAAPAFAGMLALLKQKTGTRMGQANYALYQLARTNYSTVFHDVVTGDNSVFCSSGTPDCQPVTEVNTNYLSGYNAGTGYDEASGLGSVDAIELTGKWASASFTATTSSLQLNGATAALNITHGASVTVSDAVFGPGGTPSGNIALVDNLSPASQPNAESIASFPLSSGTASGATTSLPGGTYQVSAHYGGDSTFAQSDSNTIQVTIAPESSTTTLKVAGIFDPTTGKVTSTPTYGFIYLLDAQPYGNSSTANIPNGAATGAITFKTGSTNLGTTSLSSQGVAELQTTLIPAGNNSLTAEFPGDPSFQPSTSAPVSITVTPAATTLSIPTFAPFDPYYGANENLSVTLTADSAGGAPTGAVTFMNGATAIGAASVVGLAGTTSALATATASFTVNNLPSGANTVTAIYSGDSNYAAATSPSVSVYIEPNSTTMSLTPPNPTITVNQPLQFTATLSQGVGLPVPTGTVQVVYNQTGGSVTGTLVNGAATLTIPANSLILGVNTLGVQYSGDKAYAGATGIYNITVKSSGTVAPVLKVTAPASITTFPVSVTVTISGPSGDPVPTGNVTLTNPNYVSTQTLTQGSAIFVLYSGLNYGPNTLSASYLGDNTYTAGTATTVVTLPGPGTIVFNPHSPTIGQAQSYAVNLSVATTSPFPAPTGTISISSGSYSSSATPLTSGSASITIPANTLPLGMDTLTATYSGDTNYLPSVNSETITVNSVAPGLAISGNSLTLSAGAKTGNTTAITVTPAGGFTGSVAMTAAVTSSPAGAQYPPTLSFGSTTPVSITGASASTAVLTITTTAPTTVALSHPRNQGRRWYSAAGVALACVLLFSIPARRRGWRNMLGLMALFLFLASGVLACGGGGGGGGTSVPGTTPGSYNITVTGTSGTVSANGTVTLTVQ